MLSQTTDESADRRFIDDVAVMKPRTGNEIPTSSTGTIATFISFRLCLYSLFFMNQLSKTTCMGHKDEITESIYMYFIFKTHSK